jgi:ribosomal protein S18 acetylase RimI-like enzyme
LDSEQISPESHAIWFESRIARQSSEPFTFFEGISGTVGMTRLDSISGTGEGFVLSIIVNPAYQGLGIGGKILEMTCELVAREYSGHYILAKVHKKNYVSHKLFLSSGFNELQSEGDFLKYFKSL